MQTKRAAFFVLAAVLFINMFGVSVASAQTVNLFTNASVETASGNTPQGWATDVWGSTKATFTYPTGGAEDGSRFVKTQITTKGSGDAKWYPNHVASAANQTYSFSDWYQSTVASTVQVEVLLTTGKYTYIDLGAPATSAGWKQFTATFKTPANTKSITVFHFIQAVGVLSVDNYSLSSGTVTPPPPPPPAPKPTIGFFKATPISITAGSSTVLSWNVTNASSTSVDHNIGTVSGSSVSVSPSQTTTYMLTATNPQGSVSTTTTVTVIVPPPPPPPALKPTIAFFKATPIIITAGSSTVLSWNVTNASSTSVDHNIGTVSGSSVSVSPTQTTTYTLTATNPQGSLSTTTTVTVTVPPPPPPPPPTNIIKNPSVETVNSNNANLPTNWSHEKWGKNTTTFTYIKNAGHTGTNSVKVQITKYTDGDAKWMPAAVVVTPGESYRLTDWYMSDIENYPVVDFALSDGTDYYLGLRPQDPAATWTQFSESFQVPANATSMHVMHLISAVGTLSLDDMSIEKITPKGFTRPIVTINFDDGWEDDTISALPVLNNLGFKATWFFATTYLESTPATGPINVSGPTALHALYNDGMEIGGHTVTHPDLTTLSQTDLTYELTHSKEYLESVVGAGTVTNLATPYGTYSDQVIATAKPMYQSLRSTDEGFNTSDDFDQYRLEVQNMQQTTTQAQFQSWIDQAVKDKSWLVLVYHRVATTSLEDFDTPVADFKPQMEYLKQSGVAVLTTEQALNEVLPQMGL